MRSYTELADFRQSDFTGYPVVFCDARASRMSKPYSGVVHDSSETATLAAKELLSLGFKDYAFVGNLQPREWNLCNEMLSVVYKVGCRGLGGRIPAGSEATRGGGIYTDISGNANVKAWRRANVLRDRTLDPSNLTHEIAQLPLRRLWHGARALWYNTVPMGLAVRIRRFHSTTIPQPQPCDCVANVL